MTPKLLLLDPSAPDAIQILFSNAILEESRRRAPSACGRVRSGSPLPRTQKIICHALTWRAFPCTSSDFTDRSDTVSIRRARYLGGRKRLTRARSTVVLRAFLCRTHRRARGWHCILFVGGQIQKIRTFGDLAQGGIFFKGDTNWLTPDVDGTGTDFARMSVHSPQVKSRLCFACCCGC